MLESIFKRHARPVHEQIDPIEQRVQKLYNEVLSELCRAGGDEYRALSNVADSCRVYTLKMKRLNQEKMSTEQLENLPVELKLRDNCMLYVVETVNKKLVKELWSAHYEPASVYDPFTWDSFEACTRRLNDGFFHGVGFALTWGLGVIGLHFDTCVDPTTGEITDRNVARWVDRFDSYTEFSGRGNGLNVLVKGILRGRRRRAQNIQLFGPGRVLFATGKPMQNSSKSIKHRQEQLDDFYHEIFGRYSDLGAVRRDWELG